MSCLGVHFAVDVEMMNRLLVASDDAARSSLIEEIEENGDYDDWSHDCDKSWDALHRCLAGGKLEWDGGAYPLNHTVLGGTRLYDGNDYIICLVTPEQVPDVGAALAQITENELRQRYEQIPEEDYGATLSEEDFLYTWDNFPALPNLFKRAAEDGRAMIFTVDQ